MNRALLVPPLLLLLLVPAFAEERTDPKPIHMKLKIGVAEILTVHVKLEGESYEVAQIDLGADGTVDETRKIERKPNPRTGKPLPSTKLAFTHEGSVWEVDYTALGADRPTTYVRWNVKRGDEYYAWFINARVPVHTSAEAAKAAKAIRLGPPFAFELTTAQRGRDALVNTGLKDAQGGTLRLARVNGELRKPTLALVREEKTAHSGEAEYG